MSDDPTYVGVMLAATCADCSGTGMIKHDSELGPGPVYHKPSPIPDGMYRCDGCNGIGKRADAISFEDFIDILDERRRLAIQGKLSGKKLAT